MNGKVWKIGCLYVLVSSLIITGVANAVCTPKPDCASIGYTDTSCEGKFVRCPFDISKLYCLPCDSSFKYDCSGDNMVGGMGSSCGGKYASCTCLNGGIFNHGECSQNCTVGMICYSDKSCSEDVDISKTPIGIVVKDNELIVALEAPIMSWSSYSNIDINEIINYDNYNDAMADYNGKANTLAIALAHPDDMISINAAKYCMSYSVTGTVTGDWYLPAVGELNDYLGLNFEEIKITWNKLGSMPYSNIPVWSSSEMSEYAAWNVDPRVSGSAGWGAKHGGVGGTYNCHVSCFLEI